MSPLMKVLIVLQVVLVALVLSQCGNGDVPPPPIDHHGTSLVEPAIQTCTVVKINNTATISCPDGTSATISDGIQGAPGICACPYKDHEKEGE